MAKVILAEKPSVAKNIAEALKIRHKRDGYFEGNGYYVTWAYGHLLQLYDAKDYDPKMASWKLENFPFIPSRFQYKVKSNPKDREKTDRNAERQLKVIYQLIKKPDVDGVISACDYDREGQIIGDTVIYKLKTEKQVYRLLLNEWTPSEVLKGLEKLKLNSEMKPLQDAGISRQWADWLIGINLTSVATLQYQKGKGKALNIGRVLLPTLKIIYDRDKEIETFVEEEYFKLVAKFKTQAGDEFEGIYTDNKQQKFNRKETLEQIKAALEKTEQAKIVDKTVERKKEYPPYLFNLSNLQGYITSKYKGWNSSKVLKVAQSLYEKKFITYPRTASIVLEESLVGKAKKVLDLMIKGLPYEQDVQFKKLKRVFDNSKVDSHSAIIPTYLVPKTLTSDEQIVYQAIKNRFIMQFMPVAQYDETILITKSEKEAVSGDFVSKGRVQILEGWKQVEKIVSKETILPAVSLHESVSLIQHTITNHQTKPPKPHTEKTLLKVMETCGKGVGDTESEQMMEAILSGYSIGTPATRADTIKKLQDVGYISAIQKSLVCTELGKKLVETFPIKELFDLEFTGRLEKALSDIEKQQTTKEQFLQFITNFTIKAVQDIKNREIVIRELEQSQQSNERLGKCPVCQHDIIEGKKGFGCSNWKRGCKFVIWKNDKFLGSFKKRPTKTMVKTLLTNGVVQTKGLTSKNGKKFTANLRYVKNENNDYFSWKMEF